MRLRSTDSLTYILYFFHQAGRGVDLHSVFLLLTVSLWGLLIQTQKGRENFLFLSSQWETRWQYIYIYIYIRGASEKYLNVFVQAFKIVLDSWKFSMVLPYILWDDWSLFYDFSFKWTATAAIGIHPTKPWLSQQGNCKNAIWMWGHFKRTICNKIPF